MHSAISRVSVTLGLAVSPLCAQTVTWNDTANGQLIVDCDPGNPGGEFFWPDNNLWSQDQLIGLHPCDNSAGFEREPSNWSTPGFPNSTTVDVVITGSTPTVLNLGVSVGTLQVDPAKTLQIPGQGTLNVFAGSIVNNGSIDLEDTVAGASAFLRLHADTALSGAGTIRFDSDGDNIIDSIDPAHVLTIGVNQTLLATSDALATESRIATATANDGTITADQGGLRLDTHPKENRNLIRAINGGTLAIASVVDNSLGTITAGAGSSVQLVNGGNISGGLLDGSGTFDVVGGTSRIAGLTIDPAATLALGTTDLLLLAGTVTNHGTIVLDDVGGSTARLRLDGNATLAGSGQVVFQSDDDNIIESIDPLHLLTIGVDQELTTSADAIASTTASRITAGLINHGTVTANQGGLLLNTNAKTNQGLMRATNGGTLVISSPVENSSGTLMAATGSIVRLFNGGQVTGGSLQGPGIIEASGGSNSLTGPALTIEANATISIITGGVLNLVGTVTNHGRIEMNDLSAGTAFLRINGNATLDGTGKVIFNSNDDNILDSVDAADVLTIAADQEVTTSADAQPGFSLSRLVARVLNHGTITADEGGVALDTNLKTNQGLFRAIHGGNLRISDVTVENSSGTIAPAPASTVELDGATIQGGLIAGEGLTRVIGGDSFFENPALTVAAGATVEAGTGGTLHLTTDLTNDGTLAMNDTTAGFAIVRLDDDVTLLGSGRVLFGSNGDNIVDSSDPGHTLTIPSGQLVTTTPTALVGRSFLRAAAVNDGIVEARGGALSLDTNAKTNNAIFRAIDGGELEVRTAGTILTNYNATTDTLSGGRWEVIANGTATLMDFQSAPVATIAAGTEILLSGAGASFPALGSLTSMQGVLALDKGAMLATTGNLALGGRLDLGLTDGSSDGFDFTRLTVTGDVDFTGGVIDVRNLGLTPGSYEVVTWTGFRTGLPTLGIIPDGADITLSTDPTTLFVEVNSLPLAPPEIISIEYEAATNTTTITYQSLPGEVFSVFGGTDLPPPDQLPDTVTGTGAILDYLHNPPGAPPKYFYRFFRD